MQKKALTRKQICKLTGVKPHVVAYYTNLGRIPLIHESNGAGDYHVFHPKAVHIFRQYAEKKLINNP